MFDKKILSQIDNKNSQDRYGFQSSSQNQFLQKHTHGENITEVMQFIKNLLEVKQRNGQKSELTKQEMQTIIDYVYAKESSNIHYGVNFSRIQIDDVLRHEALGDPVEFETFSPYLVDYQKYEGLMTMDNLTHVDKIGIKLAPIFRKFFPKARFISLYDEYNTAHYHKVNLNEKRIPYNKLTKQNFKKSIIELLKTQGIIPQNAIEKKNYLLIAESKKTIAAQELVKKLEEKNFIKRNENEIFFINDESENQLYRQIQLRTKTGHWLCEALDAATYLKKENLSITHVVVLPEYLKTQQDKVWEILRVLGIMPKKYHNIFFDIKQTSEKIAQIIEAEFNRYF